MLMPTGEQRKTNHSGFLNRCRPNPTSLPAETPQDLVFADILEHSTKGLS